MYRGEEMIVPYARKGGAIAGKNRSRELMVGRSTINGCIRMLCGEIGAVKTDLSIVTGCSSVRNYEDEMTWIRRSASAHIPRSTAEFIVGNQWR